MIGTKLKIGAAIVGALGTGAAIVMLATFSSGISQSVESGGENMFPAIRVANTGTFGGRVTVGSASPDQLLVGGGSGTAGIVAVGSDTDVNLVLFAKGAGAVNITGGSIAFTGTVTGTGAEWTFPVTIISGAVGTGVVTQVTATNAGGFKSAKYTTQSVGVGAGNFVIKVCSDTTCSSSGFTLATCTLPCTTIASTVTACVAGGASAWSAAQDLYWVVTTSCATDPIGNGLADMINE